VIMSATTEQLALNVTSSFSTALTELQSAVDALTRAETALNKVSQLSPSYHQAGEALVRIHRERNALNGLAERLENLGVKR
jgi:chaperonin cofactor prefoldin